MDELQIIRNFAEYGGVALVLAYAWWRAEHRADRAQAQSDMRATKLAECMTDQVGTNDKVSAALGLLTAEVTRVTSQMQGAQCRVRD